MAFAQTLSPRIASMAAMRITRVTMAETEIRARKMFVVEEGSGLAEGWLAVLGRVRFRTRQASAPVPSSQLPSNYLACFVAS
jgi:hypothetical protein